MKFLIIGDSWGVGEWAWAKNNRLNPVPNTGVDYFLTGMGHTVTNLSAGSAANFGQLRNCRTHLEQHSDYDYIVWLHTEPVRDIADHVIDDEIDGPKQFPNFYNYHDFDHAMEYMSYCNYEFAQSIFDVYQIPFIVVGGLGKLYPSIKNFSFACCTINSWAQQILETATDIPHYILGRDREIQEFEHYDFSLESKIRAIEAGQQLDQMFKQCDKFPDNIHPCREEFQKLANQLLEMINARPTNDQ